MCSGCCKCLSGECMPCALQFYELDLPPVLEEKIRLVDAVIPDAAEVRPRAGHMIQAARKPDDLGACLIPASCHSC